MVLVVEADHCVPLSNEVDVHDVRKGGADVELTYEFSVEAGEEPQHCAFGACRYETEAIRTEPNN